MSLLERDRFGFVKRLGTWPAAILTLVTANLVTFSSHYRGISQFPADFPMGYYGFVAYWTAAIERGVLPEWMPFQEMGYPFFANLQTGIAYPPFWIFPLTGMEYTMHAAVIVQVLHVLWGAIGAYALGRLLFGKGAPALLLGVCYHFFGGFYSNAQHTDIIRAFAWLPWLLFAAHLVPGQARLAARNYMLPLVVAFTVTGSYPGNIASHFLIVGIYVVALFLSPTRPSARLLPAVLLLIGVGIALSAPMLVPGWALKDNLVRSTGQRPPSIAWSLTDWGYLFLPWHHWWARDDVAMLSAFLPLPAFALIAMLRRASLRPLVPFFLVVLTSLAMLPGTASRIARVAYAGVSFLGLSRFPSSDYRAPFVLGLIVLGAASLATLLDEREGVTWASLRTRLWIPGLLFFFLVTGQAGFRAFYIDLFVVLVALAGSVALMKAMLSRTGGAREACGYGIVLLAGVTACLAIHSADPTWRAEDTRARYMRTLGFYPEAELPVTQRFEHALVTRPPRHDTPNVLDFSWRGYLEGSYEMRDTTAPTYQGEKRILDDPELHAFMAGSWRAVKLDASMTSEGAMCAALEAQLSDGASTDAARSIRYGVNDAVIAVRLDAPALIVENETYFPGWEGRLVARGRELGRVTPEAVCEGVRMWRLPRGEYALHTRYVTPRLRESLRVTLGIFVAYVLFLALALGHRIRSEHAIAKAVENGIKHDES